MPRTIGGARVTTTCCGRSLDLFGVTHWLELAGVLVALRAPVRHRQAGYGVGVLEPTKRAFPFGVVLVRCHP